MRWIGVAHPQITRDGLGRLTEHPRLLQRVTALQSAIGALLGGGWYVGPHPRITDGSYVIDLEPVNCELELGRGDEVLRHVAARLQQAATELEVRAGNGAGEDAVTSREKKVLRKLADVAQITRDVYIAIEDDDRVPLPLPDHAFLADVEVDDEEAGTIHGVVFGINVDPHGRIWARVEEAGWMLAHEAGAFDLLCQALANRLAVRGTWRRVNGQTEVSGVALIQEGIRD